METRVLMRMTIALMAVLVLASAGVQTTDDRRYEPIAWADEVSGKNFPLFAIVDVDDVAGKAVASSPGLRTILDAKRAALDRAASACALDAACHVAALAWSADDVMRVSDALRVLTKSGALASAIDRVRRSGLFARDAELGDEAFVVRAWERAAGGLNRILAVYGRGEPPRYPAIDSVSHDAASADYGRLVHTAIGLMHERADAWERFYEPSRALALRLLDLNWRDEAARHEPMHLGENAEAYTRIPTIAWADYPYTVALVPGAGLSEAMERENHALSPMGKLIIELAARRYHDRKVPLIIVSGGYVHPKHSRFAEAVEMKRVLMRDFDVPANAILIDPHARHTTTNLRNAARIMFRYGIPTDRLSMITTDQYQSVSIESKAFDERCDRELGYRPYELRKRLSRYDLEWLPRVESLHVDGMDPLDP